MSFNISFNDGDHLYTSTLRSKFFDEFVDFIDYLTDISDSRYPNSGHVIVNCNDESIGVIDFEYLDEVKNKYNLTLIENFETDNNVSESENNDSDTSSFTSITSSFEDWN